MADAQFEDREFSVGRVLSRGFAVLGAHPLLVFGIAFVVGALPKLALAMLSARVATQLESDDFLVRTIVLQLVGVLVGIVLASLVQGAIVQVTVGHAAGRRVGLAASLGAGLRAALPLVAVSIMAGVAIVVGLALLIVPGVVLWVMWSVGAPVVVAERRGPLAALSRSAALTRGVRWQVLALELVVLVLYWIATGIGSALLLAIYGTGALAMGAGDVSIGFLAYSALLSTLLAGVESVVRTSLYIELRDRLDGPPEDALADIFA